MYVYILIILQVRVYINYLAGDTLIMRLLGDPTERATVEIYDGFNWGRVCEFLNIETAAIVCRHSGYQTALAAIPVPKEVGIRRPKILQTRCEEHATSLLQCDTQISEHCLCSKYDAGVICSQGRKSAE